PLLLRDRVRSRLRAASAFPGGPGVPVRTNVYIDAFNLYYGCLKGTPYKWLDLEALCRILLPKNDVIHIKYFTARISAQPHDPSKPTRQQTYLRALDTLP